MHTSGDHNRPRQSRLKKFVVPGLAALAILAGIAMAMYGARPRTYGWFAYAPLSETTFDSAHPDSFMFVDLWSIAGLVLIAGGILALVLVAGRRMGRRRLKKVAAPSLAVAAVLAGAAMVAYAGMPREYVSSESVTLTQAPEFQETMSGVFAWGFAGVVLMVAGGLVLTFMAGHWVGRRR